MKKQKQKLSVRFNFVMTEEERHYLFLIWKSQNNHQPPYLKTTGAVLRHLIRQEIARQSIKECGV
jgi:hypothetical protein